MNNKKILILLLGIVLVFSGCIPSQFTKGVDADDYPGRDLPIYDGAVIFEYDSDGEEVTIKYGSEDDVEDIMEFYQDYFEEEGIILDEEEDDDDEEYMAEGFYEDFLFEINVEEAEGKNEEKVFSAVAEVVIEFLDDEEIEERQGGNLEKELIGFWEMITMSYEGQDQNVEGMGLAMEFFADGTMDMYLFYMNDGMTGNDWSITEDGELTYYDSTILENTTATLELEKAGKDVLLHVTEEEDGYTLRKTDKDEFLQAEDDMFAADDDVDSVPVPNVGEQVLMDQDDVKVSMKGFEVDYYSLNLNLLIENANKKQIDLELASIIVNGYSLQDAYIIGVVDPEAKLNTEISFALDELALCNIKEIVDIELVFELNDYESWDTISYSDVIQINTDSSFVQTYDISGTTLVDEAGVKVVYQGFVTDDDFYGPYVILYLENNTEQPVVFNCDQVQINGFMVSGFLYGTVQPDTCTIMTLDFYSSDLEDNGIEVINEIKLAFQCNYEDEWDYFCETDQMVLPIN